MTQSTGAVTGEPAAIWYVHSDDNSLNIRVDNQADAHLLAAAPRMLQALKAVWSQHVVYRTPILPKIAALIAVAIDEAEPPLDDDSDIETGNEGAVGALVDAAIAKARNESPGHDAREDIG